MGIEDKGENLDEVMAWINRKEAILDFKKTVKEDVARWVDAGLSQAEVQALYAGAFQQKGAPEFIPLVFLWIGEVFADAKA